MEFLITYSHQANPKGGQYLYAVWINGEYKGAWRLARMAVSSLTVNKINPSTAREAVKVARALGRWHVNVPT